MAISDLTNTTWVFNTTLSEVGGPALSALDFTCNGVNYTYMTIQKVSTVRFDYGSTRVYNGAWYNEAYRTITITGGNQATNASLIAWFQSNAVMQAAIPDLTGTTWVFNNSITVTPLLESEELVFLSGDALYTKINWSSSSSGTRIGYYLESMSSYIYVYSYSNQLWNSQSYRTIKILMGADVSSTFYEWLSANAIQQPVRKYIADEVELSLVAAAIRGKIKANAPLEWPSGYVNAISDITVNPEMTSFNLVLIDQTEDGIVEDEYYTTVFYPAYDADSGKILIEEWEEGEDAMSWEDIPVAFKGENSLAQYKTPWVTVSFASNISTSVRIVSVTNGYAALCERGLLVAPSSNGATVRVTLSDI